MKQAVAWKKNEKHKNRSKIERNGKSFARLRCYFMNRHNPSLIIGLNTIQKTERMRELKGRACGLYMLMESLWGDVSYRRELTPC